MDRRYSPSWSRDAHRETPRSARTPLGLQRDPVAVELSGVVVHRHRSGPAPKTPQALWCRHLLERLFRCSWPERAGEWADQLIAEYGSVSAVLAAGPVALARTVGDPAAVELLGAIRAVVLRGLENEAFSGPVLSTNQHLIDFLRADMAHATVERFRVLFLNTQNRLLGETVTDGSVN